MKKIFRNLFLAAVAVIAFAVVKGICDLYFYITESPNNFPY